MNKPGWLNKKINLKECGNLNSLFKDLSLNTVCREALCPNIGECFSANIATFLILGKICTRNCGFCAVIKGESLPVDADEPRRIARAIKRMGLKHVVITSVTRDDLPDGGASVFAQCISCARALCPDIKIEVLTPDFQEDIEAINTVVFANPDVFAHNMETVSRLYPQVRAASDYQRSLRVLSVIKKINPNLLTKSGIMLGLGEEEEEVLEFFDDLRDVRCDFLSIGQYLAPTKKHFPVKNFLPPDVFARYKEKAKKRGFLHVETGPYVRSSYFASEYLVHISRKLQAASFTQTEGRKLAL